MKNKIQHIINNLTMFKLIVYSFLFLEVFIVLPYLIIINYFKIETGGADLSGKSIITIYFIGVIFVPLLETLIFQTVIINLVKKAFPKLPIISIIISSVLFGLSHFYSIAYILYTILMGIIFAYSYILSQKKEYNPFLVVFSIHALHNLTTFIV